MALIGNEMEYAKKILTGAVKEKNLFKALVILTKYYCFELGMNDKEIEKNLRLYIKAMGGDVDDEAIESIIKSNTSSKTNVNKLDHIIITIQEWQTIQEMGRTERERKLLFTLLCMYKVKIGLGYSDNGLVKIEYTQLGRIQNEIMNLGFKVKDTIYSEDVEIIVYSKIEDVQSLTDRMIDITSGTADVSIGEEYYLSEKDGQLIL